MNEVTVIWTSGKMKIDSAIKQAADRYFGGAAAERDAAVQRDCNETAAWYGRGEKPEPKETVDFEFKLFDVVKPPKPGLFTAQGDGRYQGLGFCNEEVAPC